MLSIPFAIRRPGLLLRGLTVDRDRPDLEALANVSDPESFVWAMLPHAARSFAASIVMLPRDQALVSAVAYLYARVLDTYEDLVAEPEAQRRALLDYAARFSLDPLGPAPPITSARVVDDRDRAHLLLIDRIDLIDCVFAALPTADQASIVELVAAMADGMTWASRIFEEQRGVLETPEQRALYCHHVIGQPALFVLRLMTVENLDPAARHDALAVSELIQMANITRDIGRDLRRGVAYHPDLRRYVKSSDGSQRYDLEEEDTIRRVKAELLAEALIRAPAYGRLLIASNLPRVSRARGSAVLMLLFTDRYYRQAVVSVGGSGWHGPVTSLAIYTSSLLAAFSVHWASRVVGRVEESFLTAAAELMATAHR